MEEKMASNPLRAPSSSLMVELGPGCQQSFPRSPSTLPPLPKPQERSLKFEWSSRIDTISRVHGEKRKKQALGGGRSGAFPPESLHSLKFRGQAMSKKGFKAAASLKTG